MKRSKHSLSNYKLATFDMGELVPVGMMEALPGDTFQQSTSMLLRVMPQLGPVMHPVMVRIHHWFVPYRLLFDTQQEWENFITGGNDGVGEGAEIPTNLIEHTVSKGELADYMGLPPAVYPIGKINLLPFRAYNLIYNEFYRDQDLMLEASLNNVETLHKIAWEKDYFTTARLWTQRGPSVTVPIGTSAPITLDSTLGVPQKIRKASDHTLGNGQDLESEAGSGDLHGIADVDLVLDPNGTLIADLSSATAQSINALRQAFALQRYAEARAQYGTRYVEWLRYYGIKPSDARLNRPEYLGGGKQVISFSEVVGNFVAGSQTTGQVSGSSLGTLGGHGIAALRSNRYRYFCEEHGVILTLCSVRPRSMYTDGLHKFWSKRTKEEFYTPELAQIGQQEILTQELRYTNTGTDDDVFGYQDRYSDYRHIPSTIAGDFRDTFNSWHLGRLMASTPSLNQSFIECVPTKRAYAVQNTDILFGMFSHSVQARRRVGHNTIGRII